MTDLIVLIACGLVGLAGIVLVRQAAARRWRRELVSFRVRFPRDLDPRAVAAFVAGLSGLAAPHWQRWFAARVVLLEVRATDAGITHHLLTSRSLVPLVLNQLRAACPAAAVDAEEVAPFASTLAGELRLSTEQRALATDRPADISAAILSSLAQLEPGQELRLQWLLTPTGPTGEVSSDKLTPDERRALRAKRSAALFLARARLGVRTSDAQQAEQLLGRLTATFHLANRPGVHLRRSAVPSRWVARWMAEWRLPVLRRPSLLNANELVGLLGWPLGGMLIPGLELGGCRQLPPSAEVATSGLVLAEATFPGPRRRLALPWSDTLRHLHLTGPSGVGKSTLVLNIVCQAMLQGLAVFVLDPAGDLVRDILARVPDGRVKDVVMIDPADAERAVGTDLFAGAAETPDLVVEQTASIIHELFRASWGPRTDDLLRAALATLVQSPGMTLVEIPLLLTSPAFRRRLVARLDDPVVLQPFWRAYDAMSEAERAAVIAPLMNKLRALTLRRSVRHLIGQSDPAFSMADAIRERRIVLVSLSKGLIGDEASALLGSLLVGQLWRTIGQRAALPQAEREPVLVAIDEAQSFLHMPKSLGDILAEARKLGLATVLSHQHLGQLPTDIRRAVMANAASRVVFRPTADDARVFARELAPYLTANDLQGLRPHEVVLQLASGTGVTAPVTGRTMPPPPPTGNGDAAWARSRVVYGADRDAVEAGIRARHETPPGPGDVGRRRAVS
jgi:hypothetical protein